MTFFLKDICKVCNFSKASQFNNLLNILIINCNFQFFTLLCLFKFMQLIYSDFFFILESKEETCSLGGAQVKRMEKRRIRSQIKRILKVDFMSRCSCIHNFLQIFFTFWRTSWRDWARTIFRWQDSGQLQCRWSVVDDIIEVPTQLQGHWFNREVQH